MATPSNSFTKLGGVPVHYDRFSDPRYAYGTRGKPHTFYCLTEFETKLDGCLNELWRVCPLGQAEIITSAGAYVNKSGAHGCGRGFDLDAVFWADKNFVTLHYPQDKRFYLGVEAVLRKHFGTVLNHEYNAAHRDHFHIDDLSEVGFRTGSKSRVLFLQMAISHVFGKPIAVDGGFGDETSDAAKHLLLDLGLATASQLRTRGNIEVYLGQNWLTLLDKVSAAAFEGLGVRDPDSLSPADFLFDTYRTIEAELGDSPRRKAVETALTAFANHSETISWLAQWEQPS